MHSRRVTWQSNFWNLFPIAGKRYGVVGDGGESRAEQEGKDLEGGRGRERELESKESKELFQASLPRPARLNFFSAQEFSYYSKFSAARRSS